MGDATLQVSYGRDANSQLTAILTAPNQNSVALHFSAGGKSIDAEKAVVTLTFSPDLKGVVIDPGYTGTVEVDSHVLRARSLADDLPMPPSGPSDVVMPNLPPSVVANANVTPAPVAPSSTGSTTPAAIENPAPVTPAETTDVAQTAPAPSPAPVTEDAATPAPLSPATPLASQLAPMLAPTANASTTTPAEPAPYKSVQQRIVDNMQPIAPGETKIQKLYWSEPITAPDGTAPSVAVNEIRLVEVRGTVTVIAPGGMEQNGTEGMVVPTGATVRTAFNSSAALFMGGVNSARLMPNCELTVSQTLAGPVRTNVINLRAGAVFSRIGHRDGETENYSIITPEGITNGAEANDMMAFRGTPDDAGSNGLARLDIDTRTLLAWDPAPARGLISDVPGWNLSAIDSKDKDTDKGGKDSGKNDPKGGQNNDSKGNQKDDARNDKGGQKGSPNTYFYYCQGGGNVQSDNVRHEVFCSGDHDGRGNDGRGGNNWGGTNWGGGDDHHGNKGGGHDHQECQPQKVLQQILETLQPYNCKLKQVIDDINSGTATKAEQKFYKKLTTVFFCIQEPGIVDQFEHNRKKFDKNIDIYSKILCQDLREFRWPCLTPH